MTCAKEGLRGTRRHRIIAVIVNTGLTNSRVFSLDNSDTSSDRASVFRGICGVAVLTLVMFGDLLFLPGQRVLSDPFGDTFRYFATVREFGFSELAQGNIVLWNPHTFSGTPFLGGFQSALLYPINLIYVVLPLAKAINVDVAIHVFLLGSFMYLLARNRATGTIAGLFSAALLMFSGAYFLRVLGGHLTMLAALAWTPLIFLCIDKLFDRPSRGWCYWGIFAVTMQILAGHPQSSFFTAVACALYCLCRFRPQRQQLLTAGFLAALAVAPIFLSAAQLWTGIAAAQETVRAGGVTYNWATTFSFPPENLLTVLTPSLFGDLTHATYWGQVFFWDASLFFGLTGLLFATYGAFRGPAPSRRYDLILIVVLVVLALGRFTPVYRYVFEWVPGFDMFRGPSKFAFQITMFAALLAGSGLDAFLKHPHRGRPLAISGFVLALFAATAALWIVFTSEGGATTGAIHSLIAFWKTKPDTWASLSESEIAPAMQLALVGLCVTALTAFVLGVLILLSERKAWAAYAVAALGIIEVFGFARIYRETFDLSARNRPLADDVYAKVDPGNRVFDTKGLNYAIDKRAYSLWGYDPVMLRRYAEFMARTKNYPATALDLTLARPTQYDKLFAMLRCQYVIEENERGTLDAVFETASVAPRFLLLHDYVVLKDTDAIFAAMQKEGFDPGRSVILEQEPVPKPVAGESGGFLHELNHSTDHMTLEVKLAESALLVISDAYSEGWRVRALKDSVQQEYTLLPANYVLRAIPLSAGTHLIRVEYAPVAWTVGLAVSIVSCLVYSLFVGWMFLRPKRGNALPAKRSM